VIGCVDVLLVFAHALALAQAGPFLGVALLVSVLVHAHATAPLVSRIQQPTTDTRPA
jgi:hypothetical protein